MSEKKVRREDFEKAFKRLAELNSEYTSLFIRHLGTENESLREWVIKNHKELERLSKIIEDYKKEGKDARGNTTNNAERKTIHYGSHATTT